MENLAPLKRPRLNSVQYPDYCLITLDEQNFLLETQAITTVNELFELISETLPLNENTSFFLTYVLPPHGSIITFNRSSLRIKPILNRIGSGATFNVQVINCEEKSNTIYEVSPSSQFKSPYISIEKLTTVLRSAINSDPSGWNQSASEVLSSHQYGVMCFDELRDSFAAVEGLNRRLALLTPLTAVTPHNEIIHLHAFLNLAYYYTALRGCTSKCLVCTGILGRWTGHIRGERDLDSIYSQSYLPTETLKINTETAIIHRPYLDYVDTLGFWASYLRRIGYIQSDHVCSQHDHAKNHVSLRLAMGAPPDVNWDKFPVLKDFSSCLYNSMSESAYSKLVGQCGRFSRGKHANGVLDRNLFFPALATQKRWRTEFGPIYGDGVNNAELVAFLTICLAKLEDVPHHGSVDSGYVKIPVWTLFDDLGLTLGSFINPHYQNDSVPKQVAIDGVRPAILGKTIEELMNASNPPQALTEFVESNGLKFIKSVTEHVITTLAGRLTCNAATLYRCDSMTLEAFIESISNVNLNIANACLACRLASEQATCDVLHSKRACSRCRKSAQVCCVAQPKGSLSDQGSPAPAAWKKVVDEVNRAEVSNKPVLQLYAGVGHPTHGMYHGCKSLINHIKNNCLCNGIDRTSWDLLAAIYSSDTVYGKRFAQALCSNAFSFYDKQDDHQAYHVACLGDISPSRASHVIWPAQRWTHKDEAKTQPTRKQFRPCGIAVTKAGFLIVTDVLSDKIWRLTMKTFTTLVPIAGSGCGTAVNEVSSDQACFNLPSAVIVLQADQSANCKELALIADSGNRCLRVISNVNALAATARRTVYKPTGSDLSGTPMALAMLHGQVMNEGEWRIAVGIHTQLACGVVIMDIGETKDGGFNQVQLRKCSIGMSPVWDLACSLDGVTITVAAGSKLMFINVLNGELQSETIDFKDCRSCAYDMDGILAAADHADNTVTLFKNLKYYAKWGSTTGTAGNCEGPIGISTFDGPYRLCFEGKTAYIVIDGRDYGSSIVACSRLAYFKIFTSYIKSIYSGIGYVDRCEPNNPKTKAARHIKLVESLNDHLRPALEGLMEGVSERHEYLGKYIRSLDGQPYHVTVEALYRSVQSATRLIAEEKVLSPQFEAASVFSEQPVEKSFTVVHSVGQYRHPNMKPYGAGKRKHIINTMRTRTRSPFSIPDSRYSRYAGVAKADISFQECVSVYKMAIRNETTQDCVIPESTEEKKTKASLIQHAIILNSAIKPRASNSVRNQFYKVKSGRCPYLLIPMDSGYKRGNGTSLRDLFEQVDSPVIGEVNPEGRDEDILFHVGDVLVIDARAGAGADEYRGVDDFNLFRCSRAHQTIKRSPMCFVWGRMLLPDSENHCVYTSLAEESKVRFRDILTVKNAPLAVPAEYLNSVIDTGCLGFSLEETYIETIEQAMKYTKEDNELNNEEDSGLDDDYEQDVSSKALQEHLARRKEDERKIFGGQRTGLTRASRTRGRNTKFRDYLELN